MNRVSAYQTSDGKLVPFTPENKLQAYQALDGRLFVDREDALQRNFEIDIRSVIQADRFALVREDGLSIATAVNIIARNSEKIKDLIIAHRRKIAGIRSSQKTA